MRGVDNDTDCPGRTRAGTVRVFLNRCLGVWASSHPTIDTQRHSEDRPAPGRCNGLSTYDINAAVDGVQTPTYCMDQVGRGIDASPRWSSTNPGQALVPAYQWLNTRPDGTYSTAWAVVSGSVDPVAASPAPTTSSATIEGCVTSLMSPTVGFTIRVGGADVFRRIETRNGCAITFEALAAAPDAPGEARFGSRAFLREGRDYYSFTETFTGASGVGAGPRSARPATCTPGVGYWSTDQGGNWNRATAAPNDGTLDVCASANTWQEAAYTPYRYPHDDQELELAPRPPDPCGCAGRYAVATLAIVGLLLAIGLYLVRGAVSV
jgi:hypothetical protein